MEEPCFKHISTRGELDQLEQTGITEGMKWLAKQKSPGVLSEVFVCELPKRLFGSIWKWAGMFRKIEKNMSMDPFQIAVQLRQLLDDAKYWLEYNTFPPKKLAARLHHKLVYIHPLPNGHGHHAWIMADAILPKLLNKPALDWVGGYSIGWKP